MPEKVYTVDWEKKMAVYESTTYPAIFQPYGFDMYLRSKLDFQGEACNEGEIVCRGRVIASIRHSTSTTSFYPRAELCLRSRMSSVRIETATSKDAPVIMGLIRELAEFEKYPEGVKINEEILAKDLNRKAVEGLLLWEGEKCAAILLYYYAYSTWEGQYIHMEDLYVSQSHRRKGYGRKLWNALGKIAEEKGCRRLQWNVLDWNQNAIEFYKKMPYIDLTASEGWLMFRLNPDGIKKLAEGSE